MSKLLIKTRPVPPLPMVYKTDLNYAVVLYDDGHNEDPMVVAAFRDMLDARHYTTVQCTACVIEEIVND